MGVFHPRFDVRETPLTYELHGELPGVTQRDVSIVFTENDTLTISGACERTYEVGPRRLSLGAAAAPKSFNPPTQNNSSPEAADVKTEGGEQGEVESGGKVKEEQRTTQQILEGNLWEIENGGKYWVSEREVGGFKRVFIFSVKVLHDEVRAMMRNGVLSVVVPKWTKPEGKRVPIIVEREESDEHTPREPRESGVRFESKEVREDAPRESRERVNRYERSYSGEGRSSSEREVQRARERLRKLRE